MPPTIPSDALLRCRPPPGADLQAFPRAIVIKNTFLHERTADLADDPRQIESAPEMASRAQQFDISDGDGDAPNDWDAVNQSDAPWEIAKNEAIAMSWHTPAPVGGHPPQQPEVSATAEAKNTKVCRCTKPLMEIGAVKFDPYPCDLCGKLIEIGERPFMCTDQMCDHDFAICASCYG